MNIRTVALLFVLACSVLAGSDEASGLIVAKGPARKPGMALSRSSEKRFRQRIYKELRQHTGDCDAILRREGITGMPLYWLARYIIDESREPVSLAARCVLSKLPPYHLEMLGRSVAPSRLQFIQQALECDEDADWASKEEVHERIYRDLNVKAKTYNEDAYVALLSHEGVLDNPRRLYALAKYIIDKSYRPASYATRFILSKLPAEALNKLRAEVHPSRCTFIAQALEYDKDVAWALNKNAHHRIYKRLLDASSENYKKILDEAEITDSPRRLYALAKYIIDKSSTPVSPAAQLIVSLLTPEQYSMLIEEVQPSRAGSILENLPLA